VKQQNFFLCINTPKEVYHGNWFADAKLGKNTHDTMLKSIVTDCGININGHNLVNHSMRSTGISLWMLLGIPHAEQMDITGHRTIAGISSYSTSTVQQRKKNVSFLIPQKEVQIILIMKNIQVKFFKIRFSIISYNNKTNNNH
jgi:hypothetical protein